MRWWFIAGGFLLAVAVAATAEPYIFTDEQGDVVQDSEPYDGEHAGPVDILSGGVDEVQTSDLAGLGLITEEGPAFHLQLRDLSEYDVLLAEDQTFVTQYALTYHVDERAYSMRAAYGGAAYGPTNTDGWRFEVHDHAADTWTPVDAEIIEDAIHWYPSLGVAGLSDDSKLLEWSAAVWWSNTADDPQISDWATGTLGYEMGVGAITAEDAAAEIGMACSEGMLVMVDEADDVTDRNGPYGGAGAASADILGACAWVQDDALQLQFSLADLGELPGELERERFLAQYALSFVTARGDEYSARAMYGGQSYTGEADGAWRFNLHIHASDEWPETVGLVEGSDILWSIPLEDLPGAADGLNQWHAQAWNSFDEGGEGQQYGDHASGEDQQATVYGESGTPGGQNEAAETAGQGAGSAQEVAHPDEGRAPAASTQDRGASLAGWTLFVALAAALLLRRR